MKGDSGFRWRASGVSRAEGLSDGVFALSFTLLMLTLEVPREFDALLMIFRQGPVFALTFAALAWIWYQHHLFHRRYALEDAVAVAWNLVLLFLVLLYVYPLKFLAVTLCQQFGLVPPPVPLGPGEVAAGVRAADMQTLMLLYGAGGLAVFVVMAIMVRHAWTLREELGLDARERILTRATIQEHLGTAGVAFASILLALAFPRAPVFSGIVYAAMGPVHAFIGARTARALRALEGAPAGPS